jgi:hypothetical protein
MTHRVRSAFGRFLALSGGFAIALVIATSPLVAQQTTGKIEGTVTDQAGVPVANAQVFVVGTSYGANSNDKGYYFINNVPVGTYTVRGQFIGYAPAEVRTVRVQGGQTATVDIKMQSSAVVLTGVTVTAAANPLVPRDQVASKSIVSGDLVNDLPIDDVRNIIAVQPGVVESDSRVGLSIRGGRPGEANIYIDGAPVRAAGAPPNTSSQRIGLGTNAVEEASVTTGALGVEFADAQSGVISFTTRSGTSNYAGAASWSTDEPFSNAMSVGYNRFEGSIGGPVPVASNLTFFLSGVLEGQLADLRGFGQDKNPTYVMGGLDTVVANENDQLVAIPRFVQFTGECGTTGDTTNALTRAIKNNYGVECQGARFPMDWTTRAQFQGKLQFTYGNGSRISVTGLASGNQGRSWPGDDIGDPGLYRGTHSWSRYGILDWSHTVLRSAERALAISANLSYQRDRGITGPLDPAYEASSRSPTLGMELGSVKFAGMDGFPFPITDDLVRNVRTNNGLRVPFLNRNDLLNRQPYRMNPYGLVSGGWTTEGFDQTFQLYQESRVTGRALVDWQANRYHRFNFGGDFVKTGLSYYNSGYLRQFGMDIYDVDPTKFGVFGSDRLDLGDVVLEFGLRYDSYNSNTLFPRTPLRVYTHPRYQANYINAPTDPAQYAAFLADTLIWIKSVAHTAISPRLRVSFPVTEHTGFRLSYSHQVQSPDFFTLLQGTNSDLDITNTNDVIGRDLRMGKSIMFEFGVRHAFSQDMVLDISAYNKDKVSDYSARIQSFPDPLNVGDTLNANVLTNADFGNVRGVDVKLDRRVGNYLNASVGYTFQVAQGTGSDPLSYIRTTSRSVGQVTGVRIPPPQSTLPVDDNRRHNVVGQLALTLPSDWQKGTTLGTILRDVNLFATFRVQSGLPYTRLENAGNGQTAPRVNFGLEANADEPLNASNLPWIKNVDVRLNKGFRIGRLDWTLYADVRNALNFKNVVQLFAETGDVVNELNRSVVLSSEFTNLATEASQNSALSGTDIDLSACGTWTSPVNCWMLQRTEARFGDGNGTYTLDEQTRALNAYYDAFNGPQWFYGAPRQIRVGFELSF